MRVRDTEGEARTSRSGGGVQRNAGPELCQEFAGPGHGPGIRTGQCAVRASEGCAYRGGTAQAAGPAVVIRRTQWNESFYGILAALKPVRPKSLLLAKFTILCWAATLRPMSDSIQSRMTW